MDVQVLVSWMIMGEARANEGVSDTSTIVNQIWISKGTTLSINQSLNNK